MEEQVQHWGDYIHSIEFIIDFYLLYFHSSSDNHKIQLPTPLF